MKEWNHHSLLSRKEAAEFLGVKEITLAVWQSTRRYNVPVVKVGRLVRYRFGDLLEFVQKRTINPSTKEEGKIAHNPSSYIQ